MAEEEKKRVVVEFAQRGARVVKGSFKDVANEANKSDSAIKRFRNDLKRARSGVTSFKRVAVTSFRAVGKSISILTAPLRAIIGMFASLKAAMLAVGIASLTASADYETLQARLRSVMQTQAQATKAFEESRKFSVVTPYTPQQIVAVRTLLESVAISGQEAVKSVAEASAAMKRDIQDVASAVISMETEPLRRLGIQVGRQTNGTGSNKVTTFDFDYVDKAGQQIKKQITGFREAQKELLKILNEKFEGGILRMSKTLEGLISTLKGAWTDFLAKFGDEILPATKVIAEKLIKLINRINLKKQGEAFAADIKEAYSSLLAAVRVAGDIVDRIKSANADANMGTIIIEAMKLGGSLAGEALVATLRASLVIWKAIGEIVGSSIYSYLLTTDLPFAKGAQKKAAFSAIDSMTGEQVSSYLAGNGFRSASRSLDEESMRSLLKNVVRDNRSVASSVISETAFSDAIGRKLTNDLMAAKDELNATLENLGANSRKSFQQAVDRVTGGEGVQGYDVSANFASYRDEARSRFESRARAFRGGQSKQQLIEILDEMEDVGKKIPTEKISKFTEAVRGARESFDTWASESQNVARQMSNVMTTALDGISSSFATMVVTGENSFKSLAQSMGIMVTEMLVKLSMLNAFSAFGGASLFPGAIAGKQFGGATAGSTPYMTGEAGREMVIPQNAGYVVPNAATERLSGSGEGGGRNIRVVNLLDPDDLARRISPSVADEIVINAVSRNSGFIRGAMV